MTTFKTLTKQARGLKEASGLTIREIAKRMDLEGNPSQVQRLVDVKNPPNVTVKTLFRFAKACGFDVEIVFRRKA